MSSSREYDIVVFGATGFTGKLVVEYFIERYGNGEVTWAIAGRNETKLRNVLSSLQNHAAIHNNPDIVNQVDTIVVDSTDRNALLSLCESTKVVLTLVGPYMLYGDLLVECCVETDTDYCDLTGEGTWVRSLIDKYHDKCRAQGTRIINCTGFDSIPSDLGTLCTSTFAKENLPKGESDLVQVTHIIQKMKGGASGGTIASMIAMAEAPLKVKKELGKMASDPYYLCPDLSKSKKGPVADLKWPTFDSVTNRWYAPFIMAAVNSRVVFRSYALNKCKYGKKMKYTEVQQTPNVFVGILMTIVIPLVFSLFVFPPTRWILKKLVTQPGSGPSRKQMEEGTLESSIVGECIGGKYVVTQIKCDRDPGYSGTARMISETAVALASSFDDKKSEKGGILTTASAPGLGMQLVERLGKAGLTFKSSVVKKSKVAQAIEFERPLSVKDK